MRCVRCVRSVRQCARACMRACSRVLACARACVHACMHGPHRPCCPHGARNTPRVTHLVQQCSTMYAVCLISCMAHGACLVLYGARATLGVHVRDSGCAEHPTRASLPYGGLADLSGTRRRTWPVCTCVRAYVRTCAHARVHRYLMIAACAIAACAAESCSSLITRLFRSIFARRCSSYLPARVPCRRACI